MQLLLGSAGAGDKGKNSIAQDLAPFTIEQFSIEKTADRQSTESSIPRRALDLTPFTEFLSLCRAQIISALVLQFVLDNGLAWPLPDDDVARSTIPNESSVSSILDGIRELER